MFKNLGSVAKQCQKCGMKFDNFEHLAIHQKRFCQDGDYGTISKLELKQLEFTGPKYDTPRDRKKEFGLVLPTNDIEFKKMHGVEIQSREMQIQNDINRIKQEKAALRLKKQQEEEALVDLLREVEHRNERELKGRIEKDQIKKDIVDLEKGKTYLDMEKKSNLENLMAEREVLRQKEQQLFQDIVKLDNDIKTMNQTRDHGLGRIDDSLDQFKREASQFKAQEALLRERSDRILELKMRRDNIDLERKRIMEDKERIKNGEFVGLRRLNPAANTGNQVLNTMSPMKNYDTDNRLRSSLSQRLNEHLSASPATNNKRENNLLPMRDSYSFANNASNILSPTRVFPQNQPQAPQSQSFQVLPSANNVPFPVQNVSFDGGIPPGILEEIGQLKAKYLNGGGQDPNIIRNFDNLENFYRGLNLRTNPRPIETEKKNNQQQLILSQKEQENLKLKHELEMLKLQSNNKLPLSNQGGALTLGDMNLRLNGLDSQNKNKFSIYTGTTEFFIQNEARSVDLNEDERMAVNIAAQEVDTLRVLSQLPVGTELYRFKLEQFKELSTMRAEMEKILQEQRLLKMRRDFEKVRRDEDRKFENEKWVDEQRKNIIANRLRKDLNPTKQSKQYDPTEGFIIHWDYLLSVPKKHDSCQVVYGIYINGAEVYPPSMIEPHPCEVDTSVTNRCIFGKSHAVTEVPANANALLIFEVQLYPNKDTGDSQLRSFGWSQLDLFDARRELKRGKFKVPLYECPTDVNQDIDGIRDLTPVQGGTSWLYLRISYPFDDEIAKVQSIYPENTHMEYNIPQIHLRNFRPTMEPILGPPMGYLDPPPQSRQGTDFNAPSGGDSGPPQEPPQQVPQTEPSDTQYMNVPILPPKKKEPLVATPSEGSRSDRTPTPPPAEDKTTSSDTERRVLVFTINTIYKHVAVSHLKVSCALYEENQIVVDDMGKNCVYNTTVHNPLESNKNDISVASGMSKMSNKARGQDIIFKETNIFVKDLNRLIQKNFGKKDYYLMFQVLEKPEPIKIQGKNDSLGYRSADTANFGGMEYNLIAWYMFKLNKAQGGVNVGTFNVELFAPGLRKPPLDMSKIKKLESKIEFVVGEKKWADVFGDDYDPTNMSMSRSRASKKKKKGKSKRKSPKKE